MNFMKKKLCFLLVFVLLFSMLSSTSLAKSSIRTSLNEEYGFQFASGVLEKYYLNKDLSKSFNFSDLVSPDVEMLLRAKIKMGVIQRKILDLKYENYDIEILPFQKEKWKIEDEKMFLTLQIKRNWIYNNVETKNSELMNVELYVDPLEGCKIIDCFEPFENIILGPIDEKYRKNLTKFSSNQRKEDFLNAYIADFEEQCVEKRSVMEMNLLEDPNTKTMRTNPNINRLSFDRFDIRDWARDNYYRDQPISSNWSVPYFDFSEWSESYDCTNFVSHALLAANMHLHDDGGSGITGWDQWYLEILRIGALLGLELISFTDF